MNRTEILKLALDKAATPQEAMALALGGGKKDG